MSKGCVEGTKTNVNYDSQRNIAIEEKNTGNELGYYCEVD